MTPMNTVIEEMLPVLHNYFDQLMVRKSITVVVNSEYQQPPNENFVVQPLRIGLKKKQKALDEIVKFMQSVLPQLHKTFQNESWYSEFEDLMQHIESKKRTSTISYELINRLTLRGHSEMPL